MRYLTLVFLTAIAGLALPNTSQAVLNSFGEPVPDWMDQYTNQCNDSPEDCDLTPTTDMGSGYGAACVPNAPPEGGPLGSQVPGKRCGNCNHAGSVCPSGTSCDSASGLCIDTTNAKACANACAKFYLACVSGKCVDPNAKGGGGNTGGNLGGGGGNPGGDLGGGGNTGGNLGGGGGNPGGDLGGSGGGGEALQNPLSVNSITELLTAILDILVIIAIPIIVFFIIFAGFKYVTARGNEADITTAHQALAYAVIGGVLILGAKAIATIVENLVANF